MYHAARIDAARIARQHARALHGQERPYRSTRSFVRRVNKEEKVKHNESPTVDRITNERRRVAFKAAALNLAPHKDNCARGRRNRQERLLAVRLQLYTCM